MAASFIREEQTETDGFRGMHDLIAPGTKTTAQVIDLARAFVEERFLGKPGFRGAHLVGSIIHADRQEPFPTYRDVDVAIVLDSVDYQEIEEVFHQGYILECILSGSSRYRSADDILGLPGMACNLERNSILVDPDGHLTQIHRDVAAGFAQRPWVKKRVDLGLSQARSALELMAKAGSAIEAINALGEFIMHCSECITVAHLNPPTHRRTLANLKPLLVQHDEQALYDEILAAFGSARLSEPEVRTFLTQCLDAFDRALDVKTSSVPFEWKLDPCIRAYLEKGTLEMIEEGDHRESIFWIALFFMISTLAIQQDGQPDEKPIYGLRLMNFLRALGLDSPEAIEQRARSCVSLHAKVADYVERYVATSPALMD
jgi:hypothetical protein